MQNGGFRCAKSCSSAAVPEITQHLRSMTAAIAAAESCAMKHELKAGGGAGAEAAAAAVAAAAAPDVLAVGTIERAEGGGQRVPFVVVVVVVVAII